MSPRFYSFDLIRGDDWEGLYMNSRLVMEGHRLRTADVCTMLADHQPFDFNSQNADLEWLGEAGSFPNNLNEVRFE